MTEENFPEIRYDVLVIGGGPAGISAAIASARAGVSAAIIEKNASLGRKLCITGKGRCNITNACDRDEFFANIPENPRFLYSAFSGFSNADLIEFIESLGVKTVTERGKRVFPASMNAKDVRDALREELRRLRVKVYYGTSATDVLPESGGGFTVPLSENGMKIRAKSVVIATGGKTYPGTGSTGDGYVFAEKLGHTLTPLKPALVGITTAEKTDSAAPGLTLRNTGISFYRGQKLIYTDFGEVLFTHTGLSGPTVLSASFELAKTGFENVTVSLDLKPALSREDLDKRLIKDFAKYSRRSFSNSLPDLLPKSLIPEFVRRTGIDPAKRTSEITRQEREKCVSLLKDMRFTVTGTGPMDEAIITLGGVKGREIDPKTMESKIVPGLYFAGEIIDTTGYTGGFNLTIAFSTGMLAGKSASSKIALK